MPRPRPCSPPATPRRCGTNPRSPRCGDSSRAARRKEHEMARKANPALLGAFVLGAVALAVAWLVIFGSGKFFRPTQSWVAYFNESIKGLAVGAPVTFRGVKVGTVTDTQVTYDPKTQQIRTPVFFEVDGSHITIVGHGVVFERGRAGAEELIRRGLRAQLDIQSLVTGQLGINLDFHPDEPIKLVGGPQKYPEFPTIPSTMAALGQGLNELDTAKLVKNIQDIAQGLAAIVTGPEVKSAVAGL